MGRIRRDITGERFGRLMVTSYVGNYTYECECDCGNIVRVLGGNLVNGATQSCGCIRKEVCHTLKFKHGRTPHALYSRWKRMRQRCQNKNCEDYPDYGGRGISVCEEWSDYTAFRNWAQTNGYDDDLSIDRIDVNGPYSPDNCRWVASSEQARNKRDTIWLTIDGITRPLVEWSEISGIGAATLRWRMSHGFTDSEILVPPKHNMRKEDKQK